MTRVVTVRLECDDCRCERQGQVGQSVDQLRDALATVGWLSDKANDRDLCPRCVANRGPVAATW